MSISPIILLSVKQILAMPPLNDIGVRHLFWHALQQDIQIWEAEEVALSLNRNGCKDDKFKLLVMRLSKNAFLDMVLRTPIAQKIIEQQAQSATVLKKIFSERKMKILTIDALQHPVASGFYFAEEYETFLKQNIQHENLKLKGAIKI